MERDGAVEGVGQLNGWGSRRSGGIGEGQGNLL